LKDIQKREKEKKKRKGREKRRDDRECHGCRHSGDKESGDLQSGGEEEEGEEREEEERVATVDRFRGTNPFEKICIFETMSLIFHSLLLPALFFLLFD